MSSPSDGDTADRLDTASLPPYWQEFATGGPSGLVAGLPEPGDALVEVEITGPNGQRHVMKLCTGNGLFAVGGAHI